MISGDWRRELDRDYLIHADRLHTVETRSTAELLADPRSVALAISRHLQDQTGVTIKRLVRTLRPLHTVTIDIAGHHFTAKTPPGPEVAELLQQITG